MWFDCAPIKHFPVANSRDFPSFLENTPTIYPSAVCMESCVKDFLLLGSEVSVRMSNGS